METPVGGMGETVRGDARWGEEHEGRGEVQRLETVLSFIPAEEGEEPGEGGAEDSSFDGAGELVPREVAVEEGLEEDVEDGIDSEPGEEEAPGWFAFHRTPRRVRPSSCGIVEVS